MIRVGIVGIGFMGWIPYLAYQSQANVEVVAICSRDPGKRAGDWSRIKGNFGLPAEQATLQFEFAAFADQPESMPLKVMLADGFIERPELGDGDPVLAFEREIGEVVSCLEAGRSSAILDATLARDSVESLAFIRVHSRF